MNDELMELLDQLPDMVKYQSKFFYHMQIEKLGVLWRLSYRAQDFRGNSATLVHNMKPDLVELVKVTLAFLEEHDLLPKKESEVLNELL